ncbi:MAG: alpha/beta hydrolase-fold protein [Butyrivibrio sp.]|nr:alpha/beta hydrolase-fold protein [Butyrivibrio sp.]
MEKYMKKIIPLLLIGLLSAGCAESGTANPTVPAGGQTEANETGEETTQVSQASDVKTDFPDNTYKEIPKEYGEICDSQGSISTFSYKAETEDGEEYEKTALVYTPCGYDENDGARYNILYLMHGGSDNETWYFGGEGKNTSLKRALDNMFANGDCEPCIVVTPNYNIPHMDETKSSMNFWRELSDYLIPAVESEFRTYAVDVTEEGIKASRRHRAFAGFSMGACAAWCVYENCLDEIAYFMPISGDCWSVSGSAEKKAEYLAGKAAEAGYTSKDFCIYAGCGGTGDIAYNNMTPQLEAMAKLDDTFKFCENFKDGNFYYTQCSSGHTVNTVIRIIYSGLPAFFG